jgi:hypothetical protein
MPRQGLPAAESPSCAIRRQMSARCGRCADVSHISVTPNVAGPTWGSRCSLRPRQPASPASSLSDSRVGQSTLVPVDECGGRFVGAGVVNGTVRHHERVEFFDGDARSAGTAARMQLSIGWLPLWIPTRWNGVAR